MAKTVSSFTPKNRVAIYVRVSTTYQVDKDSLPMQRQDLIAYAKLMLETDDYVIFEDAGYSGKNTDRPRFQEMMEQIRSGLFTHLLVWKIDRISRNLLDLASLYAELKRLGVMFISKNERFDTSSAMGEAMLKIILVFAELERNITSERVTATMISRASNGLWNGGRVPFGYDYDPETHAFTINEAEAAVVRRMFSLYNEIGSLVYVARQLNESGSRSRSGAMWSPTTVDIVLTNVFYVGDYRYNRLLEGDRQRPKDESEWVTVRDHHPAIISRDLMDRTVQALANRNRNRSRGSTRAITKHVHVFQGLLVCSSCGRMMGASLAARKKDWQYSKYDCLTRRLSGNLCSGKHTSDPIVGEFVFNFLLNMLNAQRDFWQISTPEDLEKRLLFGNPFKDVEHLDFDGLNDLFNLLGNMPASIAPFLDAPQIRKPSAKSELTRLRSERVKTERALDRLLNLFLYSEDSISQAEFVIQRAALTEKLEELNEKIGAVSAKDAGQSITDQELLQKASTFILTKSLTDRSYVSYKRLATTIDLEAIKAFVDSIIDCIRMDAGAVSQIVFKNGLRHTFFYKQKKPKA